MFKCYFTPPPAFFRSCLDLTNSRFELDFRGIHARLKGGAWRAMWRSKRTDMTAKALKTTGTSSTLTKSKQLLNICTPATCPCVHARPQGPACQQPGFQRVAKRAVLPAETGRSRGRNRPHRSAKRAATLPAMRMRRPVKAASAPGCAAASTGTLRTYTPICAPPQPFAENMPPKHGPFTIIFLTFAKQKLQLKHILN